MISTRLSNQFQRWLKPGIILILLLSACGTSQTALPQPSSTSPPATQQLTKTPLVAIESPAATETTLPSPIPSATMTLEPIATPTSEPTATPFPDQIEDPHGVPMLLVPAGEFVMGSNDNMAAAKPAHTVYLDTFYIDKFEVTNALYLACVKAGACTSGGDNRLGNPEYDQYPVVSVTWYEANNYCLWRGARLPTEAEWEKAARGTDERKFPWGNDPVTCDRARYSACGWYASAVGLRPDGVSPYGVHDMAGNAWEWTNDWYDVDYYASSPAENPTGPQEATGWKSSRGGAWWYEADMMTAIWRNHAPVDVGYTYLGFRCALTP